MVRKAVKDIGDDSYVDDLASIESEGLSHKICEKLVKINKQSLDIAGGVHVGKEDFDVGADGQGIMFGYATDETEDSMSLTILMATRLGKRLTDVCKSGHLWWLRPDGKTHVTIEYQQNTDGPVEPLKVHTEVISTQHAVPGVKKRSEEFEGYSGVEKTASSMEEVNKLIEKEVIKETLKEIILKNREAGPDPLRGLHPQAQQPPREGRDPGPYADRHHRHIADKPSARKLRTSKDYTYIAVGWRV